MKRRQWVRMSLATTLTCCSSRWRLSDQQEHSLADLQKHLRAGDLTALELMQHYLARIQRMDRSGPELRAVLELHPQVESMAWVSDQQKVDKPLRGLPILIKDNIDTSDELLTTAGSLALLDAPKPASDAELVIRLRSAGALLFGKTNLSEWANFRSPNSTSGWSARGGLTRNPHDPRHTASGSSSGSSVAVAAGFCAAAIGTETNGSIISPASACGIVGLKPSLGEISGRGIIPITHHQDTAGPMTRTVQDAALIMDVIGKSGGGSYSAALRPDALRGMRFGVLRSLCGQHPAVLAVFEQALAVFREAGAILVEDVEIPSHRQASGLAWRAMFTEFRADLNAYLSARGGAVQSLADLIAFNQAYAAEEMPYFAQEFLEMAESCHTPTHQEEAAEARRLSKILAGPQGIDIPLRELKLDAFICATNDPAGEWDLQRGDADTRVCSSPAAVAGYPHLTVPMGRVNKLPIGLSFIGTAGSDSRLLAYGHAFEILRTGVFQA